MRRILEIACLQVLLVGVAATAFAAPGPLTLNLTSTAYLHIGRVLDIPIAGGPVACAGTAMTGCVAGQKPANTPVPVGGTAMVTGSNPATFTLQASAGTLVPMQSTVAFPNNPTAIQLSTSIGAIGPKATNTTDPGAPTGFTRIFSASAWTREPGRMAANFQWCPGGPNPNCTAASLGATNQRIVYTTNPNAFGGTASNVGSGGGTLSVIVGTAQGVPLVVNAPLVVASANAAVDGRFYSATSTLMLGTAPVHIGYATNFPCTMTLPPVPAGCGQIAGLGPIAPTPFPPQTNFNYGFPLTTGMVTVSKTGTNQGSPTTTILTAGGTDTRTPLGRGGITMVAGGSINRVIPAAGVTQNTMRMSVVVLTLVDPPASPSMGPMGLATGATLMLLAAGYAFRRRL